MEDPPISDQEQNKETILFKSSDAYNEMMMKLREMLGTYGINLDKVGVATTCPDVTSLHSATDLFPLGPAH
jgi:hypothetical protein